MVERKERTERRKEGKGRRRRRRRRRRSRGRERREKLCSSKAIQNSFQKTRKDTQRLRRRRTELLCSLSRALLSVGSRLCQVVGEQRHEERVRSFGSSPYAGKVIHLIPNKCTSVEGWIKREESLPATIIPRVQDVWS